MSGLFLGLLLAVVPEPQPLASDYDVMALYYPGTDIMQEWDIVRETMPERKPLLGWFDEGDPENVDWQIKWAVEHGIGTFCFCWYWDRGARFYEHWLKAYYRARHRGFLKWFMLVCDHNGKGSHSTADQVAVTRFWLDNFLKTPEYRTIDGRPVIAYCCADRLDADFIAEAAAKGETLKPGEGARRALAISEKMAKEAGLSGIYWVSVSWMRTPEEWNFTDAHHDWTVACGFDAEMTYNLGGNTPYEMSPELRGADNTLHSTDFSLMSAAAIKLAENADRHKDLPFWPCLPTGYDDTPRCYQGAWTVRNRTPEKFRACCGKIKSLCDAKGIRRVMVSPVSEWQEGSLAEPNHEYGFAYYDVIRETFCRKPEEGWPKNLVPSDVGEKLREFPEMSLSAQTVWNFDVSQEGWYRQTFGSYPISWSPEGFISFHVYQPVFNIRVKTRPFDANRYSRLRFRMRVRPNPFDPPATVERRTRVLWGTTERPIIGTHLVVDYQNGVAKGSFPNDGAWHEGEIEITDNRLWRGKVNDVWFEATDLEHADVDIDWIRFE